jgi:uncharacterized membrane protein YfcA
MTEATHSLVWLLELAGASFAGGVIGAISGLGGGIIIVPVLTLLMRVDIQHAIAASLVSVIAVSSGAGSVYVKDRVTNVRIAMFLELSTASGALIGAAVIAPLINEQVLYIAFSMILLLSLIPIFARLGEELPQDVQNDRLAKFLRLDSSYYDKHLGRKVDYNVTGIPAALVIMGFAGIISGVLGIGAGVVKVLAHEIAMRVPTKVSTATSNFMIGVTAAAGAGVYLHRGLVQPFLVVPVAVAVLAGAFLGTKLMEQMSNVLIRKVFAAALAIVGIQMLLRGIGVGP